jgi:hypothetical protein
MSGHQMDRLVREAATALVLAEFKRSHVAGIGDGRAALVVSYQQTRQRVH